MNMLRVQVNGPLPERRRGEQTRVVGEPPPPPPPPPPPENQSENRCHIILRGENPQVPKGVEPSPSDTGVNQLS